MYRAVQHAWNPDFIIRTDDDLYTRSVMQTATRDYEMLGLPELDCSIYCIIA